MTQVTGLLGVDITATPDANDFGIALGTRTMHTDDQEYVHVLAGSAITQYQWVGIDENFNAYPLTKAMADDGWSIGIAQVAFASGDYGWVAVRGHNLTAKVLGSCAADVALYTSGTAGSVDDTSASQTKIDGAVVVTANGTTAAANVEVLLTSPRSSTF